MARFERNKENKGLPKNWRDYHGAYYYRVPKGMEGFWDGKKQFRLGSSLAEAHHTFAERFQAYTDKAKTVNQLLDAYIVEKLPTLSQSSQNDQPHLIKPLRLVFGHMPIQHVKPSHCYEFVDKHKSKSSAQHSIQVLGSAFALAVEKGWIDTHPIRGQVRLNRKVAQKIHLSDDEIESALSLSSTRTKGSVMAVQAYLRLKLLTGLRRIDILQLTDDDLKEDGIHITPNKTSSTTHASIIIQWTDELRKSIEIAKQAKPVGDSPFLFCNRYGDCYVNDRDKKTGWKSMWQRFNKRLKAECGVTRNWTEALLRSRCAMDMETLEDARKLLAHSDSRTTKRHYRQKAELVKPSKRTFDSSSLAQT